MLKLSSPVWAITAYFNPANYARRLHNYRLFRAHLQVPLITVELAQGVNEFVLNTSDAEVLVQVRSESVLWQKERLLNIALTYLPSSVAAVVWLDCDIILQPDDWHVGIGDYLAKTPVMQVFSRLYDLPRDVLSVEGVYHPQTARSPSVAFKVANNTSTLEDFRPTTAARRGLGFGWVAARDLLDRHCFYDAFILGSGDRALACAAYGRFEDAIAQVRLNPRQTQHYVEWAKPFFEDVRGRVGYIDAVAFHLWHGNPTNRRYGQRHIGFQKFGFDPYTDILIGVGGCWELAAHDTDMERYIQEYFASRREDSE